MRLAQTLVPLLMFALFRALARRLPPRRAYFCGFLLYWAICWGAPLVLLGPRRTLVLLAPRWPDGRRSKWLLLLWPVAIAAAVLPRSLRASSRRAIALSVPLAIVNATSEEVFWHSPGAAQQSPRGTVNDMIGAASFALWHYAPQTIFPNRRPGGAHSLVAFAFALGLSWGVVARRSRSLLPTVLAHVALDFSGTGARLYVDR